MIDLAAKREKNNESNAKRYDLIWQPDILLYYWII